MKKCIIRSKPCDEEKIEPNLCFVSIASSEELRDIKIIIIDTLHQYSMEEYIAEDLDIPNKDIFCEKICSQILRSRFCIMVLTEATPRGKTHPEPNPNVYFEYGLATAVDKIVIPLYPTPASRAPFNVRGLGLTEYSLTKDSEKYIKKVLDDKINNAIENTKAIIEYQNKFGEEQSWYRNQGGMVYNVFIRLKEAELYLLKRNFRKFLLEQRENLKSRFSAFAKSFFDYSTNSIFTDSVPIKKELQDIARKLDKLGKSDFTMEHKDSENIAEGCLSIIDSVLKNNKVVWGKIGFYLLNFEQMLKEEKESLEVLKLRWERIDEDIFLVQNEWDIMSSCESFARNLDLFSSNEIFNFSPADYKELKEIVKGFIELYLPKISDGGLSMNSFRDSYKSLIKRCEDCLNNLELPNKIQK